MTKRGKRRFVIFLCAAAVILVAAGIIRVKLHPPRPLHEQIADYMYHSRTCLLYTSPLAKIKLRKNKNMETYIKRQ